MSTRSTDHAGENPGTILKITREITPWQLGSAVAVSAIFVATVWFNLRAQGETMTVVAADVKQVLAAQRTAEIAVRDMQYEVRDLNKRVTVLEKGKP